MKCIGNRVALTMLSVALLAGLGSGCGGLAAAPSVSPLMFLIPGLGQAKPVPGNGPERPAPATEPDPAAEPVPSRLPPSAPAGISTETQLAQLR